MLDAVTRRANQRLSRSLVKALCYRVVMVAITIVVAFAFTDDAAAALDIGIVANVVKTGAYLGYERLWARIDWGNTAP